MMKSGGNASAGTMLSKLCPGSGISRLPSWMVSSGLAITAITLLQFCTLLRHDRLTTLRTLEVPSYRQYNHIGSFELARSQSFGFFDDIPEEKWRLHQKIYREYSSHRFPEKPLTYNPADPIVARLHSQSWWNSPRAWYQNNYEPNFSCEFERRIYYPNMNGDGGKWICDPHRIALRAAERKLEDPNHPGCVVYSIGSNGDFGFELGMQNEVGEGVCEFHIFDMGNYAIHMPKELKRATYHKWGLKKQGLGVNTRPGEKFYGILDTIKLLGHDHLDIIDVFKIDCESCEWETFRDWLLEEVPILHQIQVEVHHAPGEEAIAFFDGLENEGYLIFHKEPNIQYGPDNIEYAFVKVEDSFFQ